MRAKYLKMAFAAASRAGNTMDNEEDVCPEHIIEADITDMLENSEKMERFENEDDEEEN